MTEPKTIVAIGASAGGLGPCELFFDHAPVDKGFAYVVIQHLSPDFRSLMDELLARHSSMPIHRVENGMVIEPNTIYLNRPRQVLTVADGKFVVAPEETEDVIRLPIDDFFNSIADEYGDEAVAVILSGSGSDGVRGARQIKSRGGRVFAQTPETAKFDSMPRAIQTAKLEDGSAAPEDLPELIQRHIAGEFGLGGNFYREMTSDPVFDILGLMQDRFGTNFTYYKIETVARRLNRRKDLSGHADVRDYYRTLLQDPDELETLYNDLLIEVTAFFRDKPAFDLLARDAIPEICRDMSPQRQVRMWVPGCASGEEAYTLAIQVAEFARANDKAFNLKILATDIHKRSLSAASAGIFSNETLAAVDENLIERYFEKTGDYHQVRQNLRRAVVFSPHDLLRDPPFTRMDLVSCRNVMIYLTEEAQQKLLALFHFSLNKDGYLFLGPSETTGKLHREFTQISQRWRIFRKTRDVRLMESTRLLNSQRPPMDASLALATTRKPATKAAPMRVANDPKSTAISAALHRLLGIYGPPGFLIDQSGQLTHIFGDARKHLRFNTGGFSNVLTELLREDLKPFVAPMIDRFKHGIMVEHARSATLTEEDGETIELRLLMRPLIEEDTDGGPYAIVTLEQTGRVETDIALIPSSDDADDIDRDLVTSYASRVSELEQMLGSTEESLQATIEEMETSNEELQATNEELMSANEELQSTNEELHSVNEELYTVSSEHERKIEELSELTSDMDHLLKSTAIGTIFLDSDLQVRRFTPAAAHTFNLIAQDVGRPFAHVTARFSTVDVQDIVRQVQADAKPVDSEIVSNDRSYLMRVLPYVSDVQQKPGVVITMIDIDALSRARTRIADMEQLHDEVLKDIGQLIVRWNKADGEVTYCNATFAELCGGSIADLLGTDFKTHLSAEVHAKINDATKEIAPGAFRRVMFKYTDPSGADRYFDNMLRALSDKSGNIFGFQITGRDMTPDQEYIRTLEEVLEVDRSDYPASKYGSHVAKNELARVEKLFEIVQSYLGATQLLVTIGGHDETPKPLELPAVSQPGVVPQSAYNSLEKIVSDDAASSETVGIRKVNLAGRNQHKTLLNDLGASRAIVGPIISRNAVIGRVALAVSSHHPDRDFTELELALARITIRWAGYIWDRSRTIEAIESTSAQLMLTIDHLPARVWFKDDQNKIIWLNSTAAASMGLSVENATGLNTYDQFPEMAGKYHKDDLAVINSGRPKLGIIEKFTPKHGPHGWSKTDKIPYVDPRTGARNLLVISTDITMLKNQEAEIERLNKSLNQQRGLYREIYQHTPAMMLTTDAQNRIEDANDLLARTGGYTREELIGRAMRDVFLERKRDTDLPQVDERDSGEPMRLLCSNGTLLDVELAGIDDTLADGEFRRLWVVHDVSARNLALAALEAKNSELEHLNDGLAQFAYAASHDLQEPLRKIRQYGDLLTEDYSDNLDKDGQFYVDVMTSSAERMSSLVKNLLQFSSASQGDFTPQEIPLGKLVDKVVDDYKQVIEETGATITSDTLPSVRCDENLVQIVFSNIISNALKYRAPQRAPEIKVGVEQSDDRIILSFTDNGIGFDKSEAERIFDPFVRLVSKSEAQGTGIGLAICRTICERHNWTLTASSTKGSHTRIEIRIPIESSEWAK